MRRFALVLVPFVIACSASSQTPEEAAKAQVTQNIKTQLDKLVVSTTAIQAAAPAPSATGWSLPADQNAIDTMMSNWDDTRSEYESIEGAIAVLFPDIDDSIDDRYTVFLQENGPDTDLFDGTNVTGVHAVERILWSNQITQAVIAFESQQAGYEPARFPQNMQESSEFITGLCQRMIDDAKKMQTEFATAVVLDDAAAFRGVIGSMGEQQEKVRLASTSEEESRYARHTLADMRANLDGAQMTLDAFKPWIASQKGDALNTQIQAQLDTISAAYTAIPGNSIPDVPADFNPTKPSSADLATPYGMLYELLFSESDATSTTSAVGLMDQAATLMNIPQIAN